MAECQINTIETYDPQKSEWVKIGEFPDEREVLDSVIIGDRVIWLVDWLLLRMVMAM